MNNMKEANCMLPLTGGKPSAVINQQDELLSSRELIRQLLNAVPIPLLVINRAWQVVYANSAVLDMLAPSGKATVLGLREGEEFHCIHGRSSSVEDGGEPSCRICGVARAVAVALKGEETIRDCRLTCDLAGEAHSLDLRAWATPLALGKETMSVLVLADISNEKRRALIENVYFHDLLNTLTGIRGLLDVLKHTDVKERPEICNTLDRMTLRSIEEIDALRTLTQAEESTLQVVWEELRTSAFLQDIVTTLCCHPSARGKGVVLDAKTIDVSFRSDRRLLRRVVENMLLNALEASQEGGNVSLGCRMTSGHVNFWVHNDSWMPDEIQLQIFQRSYSTKGQGRGIGTYSIKLLSSFLLGAVNFTSTQENGTVFQATFPQKPQL
ncbi:MAG: PAS domain-containing sensor histidine kinase [Steroidobacteraceae bacterium]|nr:PAS domain-containing sensor histidine kinase [Deltaproteobacteria bacterium]